MMKNGNMDEGFFILAPRVGKKFFGEGDEFKDLYGSELAALRIISGSLAAGEPMTVSEISEMIGVTKSAVSQVISSLEEKGYTYKIKSEEDKRRMYLALTDDGERIMEDINRVYKKRLNYIRKNFGEEEFDEFVRLFIKYIELCDSIDWKSVKI